MGYHESIRCPDDSGRGDPPGLLAFVNEIFIPLEAAGLSANYRSQVRRCERILSELLGRPSSLADLTKANAQAIEMGVSSATEGLGAGSRKTVAKRLRAVWAYAAKLGYVDPPPRERRQKRRAKKAPKTRLPPTPPTPGTLAADLQTMTLETAADDSTTEQYAIAIRSFGKHLGREATRSDLKEPLINAWLKSLEGRLAPITLHGRKRNITPLWNWLANQGLVDFYNPRRLRRTHSRPGPVRAWTIEQVKSLLAGADDVEGIVGKKVQASKFLRACILVAFDTGIRPGDLRRLRSDSIDIAKLSISIRQNKTKNPHSAHIGKATAESLLAIDFDDRERVFPLSKSGLRHWLDRLYAASASHGFHRRRGESIGTLRKSHATERARVDSVEAAARSLGHVSGTQTALRYYIAADAIAPLESLSCVERLSEEN